MLRAIGARLDRRRRGDRGAGQPRRRAGRARGCGRTGSRPRSTRAIPLDATPVLAQPRRLARAGRRARALPRRVAVGGRLGHARPLPRPAPAAGDRVRRRPRAAGAPAPRRRPAGGLRARRRPLADAPGGAAHALAAAPAGRAGRRPGRAAARRHDAARRRRAAADAPDVAADGERCSGRRCAAPASRRSGGWCTASGSTPTGSCSATCTAAARCPATTRRTGSGPAGGRASSTPAAGSTSRCWSTTPRPPHPYWPGGAVVLEDGGDPRPIGLLDHLDAVGAALSGSAPRRSRSGAPGSSSRSRAARPCSRARPARSRGADRSGSPSQRPPRYPRAGAAWRIAVRRSSSAPPTPRR